MSVFWHTASVPARREITTTSQGIVVATLNFEGFLWYLKPFLPSSVTLRCTIEEDPSCPGRYDWSQQTLGTDGKPDGRNKKAGSIQAHPSGDAGRCMISSLSEVARLQWEVTLWYESDDLLVLRRE